MHPLVERVSTTKVPIADLIGFRAETIDNGRAVASFDAGPQHRSRDFVTLNGKRRGGCNPATSPKTVRGKNCTLQPRGPSVATEAM